MQQCIISDFGFFLILHAYSPLLCL